MQERLNLPADRVRTVHIGIDAAGFAPPPLSPHPPMVAFLGQLCQGRGLDTLVEAFLKLRAEGRGPLLKFRAAGGMGPEDGPFVEAMRHRLLQAEIGPDFEISPGLDRAARQELLRRVSVVAVPARQPEAFGLFAIEAMAAGVPVILSQLGAYPELIEATEGGMLVEPDSSAALARMLEMIITRPNDARAMGDRGRRAVLSKFSIGRMAEGVLAVFNEVARHTQNV
jgi:glycosyltransferase involved in cell wall biosynthesis